MKPRRCQCLCGAVEFIVTSRSYTAHECHCTQCRRFSGHLWAYVSLRWEDVSFQKDDRLVWFALTDRAKRGFCGRCGTSLFWRQNGSDEVDVSAAAFDEPSGLRLGAPSFPEFKGDYYEL